VPLFSIFLSFPFQNAGPSPTSSPSSSGSVILFAFGDGRGQVLRAAALGSGPWFSFSLALGDDPLVLGVAATIELASAFVVSFGEDCH
jgi:hypothetical protein